MHNAVFLQDLAVVMMVAGLVTVTFHALKLPVVLGYILAGVLIEPHALPFPLVTDQQTIHTLSELGLVFLLFALGLAFNFRKIRQIGLTAFIVAPLETGLMFFAGYQIGQLFGWSKMDSVYLGGVLMISSTTIITKTLVELNKGKEKFAEVIYGILIAEDIIATLRKLQALGMLMAELTVRDRPNLRNKLAMRALVSNTTLFTGMIALALLLLLLSSLLLPSWEVFLVLLGLATVVAVLLRTFFIRIYAQAQVSIRETLAREPRPLLPEGVPLLPSLLENAELVTAQLTAGSPALGQQIRELQLRTRTGATAVAIRRGSETIISPEPDFEFQVDDQVLLIGSAGQLQEARRLFAPPANRPLRGNT